MSTSSFPFFGYARLTGIPYGHVLKIAEAARNRSTVAAMDVAAVLGIGPQQAGDICDLAIREHLRRKAIEDEMVKR